MTRCILAICKLSNKPLLSSSMIRFQRFYSAFIDEPSYLDIKPEIPEYETLNFRIKGYDFAVLESYTSYAHSLLKKYQLDVNSFAVPAKSTNVVVYIPNTTKTDKEFNLSLYQRVLQVDGLNSLQAPLLFQQLQNNLPSGVELNISPPTEEEVEFRYVPDLVLQDLQSEIAKIDKAREDRKK